MIKFFNNQFKGNVEEGTHRTRVFAVDGPEFKTPGMVTAIVELNVLRLVTMSPPSSYEVDASTINGVKSAADIVNQADDCAAFIARVLHLGEYSCSFFHS